MARDSGRKSYTHIVILLLMRCIRPILRELVLNLVKKEKPHGHKTWSIDDFLACHKRRIEKELPVIDKYEVYKNILYPSNTQKTDTNKWDLTLYVFVLTKVCKIDQDLGYYFRQITSIREDFCKAKLPLIDRDVCKDYKKRLERTRSRLHKQLRDDHLKKKTESRAKRIESRQTDSSEKKEILKQWKDIEVAQHLRGETKKTGVQKYLTIQMLLSKSCCEVMQSLVFKSVKEKRPEGAREWSLDNFLFRYKSRISRRIGSLDKLGRPMDILFPKRRPTEIEDWDISLLCWVLLNVCFLTEGTADSIGEIRTIRNCIDHDKHSFSLSDSEYSSYVKRIKKSIDTCLSFIGDEDLSHSINDQIEDIEQTSIDKDETIRRLQVSRQNETSEREQQEKYLEGQQNILTELSKIVKKFKDIEIPDCQLELVISNCDEENENSMSKAIVKEVNGLLEPEQGHSSPRRNEKFRASVKTMLKEMKAKGWSFTNATEGSVLLNICCGSFHDLCEMFNTYRGNGSDLFVSDLESALQCTMGVDVKLHVVMYDIEIDKCVEKIVSAVMEKTKEIASLAAEAADGHYQSPCSSNTYFAAKVPVNDLYERILKIKEALTNQYRVSHLSPYAMEEELSQTTIDENSTVGVTPEARQLSFRSDADERPPSEQLFSRMDYTPSDGTTMEIETEYQERQQQQLGEEAKRRQFEQEVTGYTPKLVDKDFQNCLKASLALNITKEGIDNAMPPEQILNNDLCSKCKIENILTCPTRGICKVETGVCSFHYCQQKQYRPCPNHVCDRLREKIKQCHNFDSTSWKNTRAENWCSSPWDIAKCYMPPDGYRGVSSVKETDCNGILSVIINNLFFQNKVDMSLCDQECNERVAERLTEGKAHSNKLDIVTSTSLQNIVSAQTSAVCSTDNAKRAAIKDIKKQKHEVNHDIHTQQIMAVTDIDEVKQTFFEEIKHNTSLGHSDTDYQRLKADLKQDLLTFYQHHHNTIPLSPLYQEHNTPLIEFYVQPNLNTVEVQKTTFRGPAVELRKPIVSLKDVFYRKSEECKNIVLTSGAGQGKTMFCKYLVLTWCDAHKNPTSENRLSAEDIRIMKDFEYIFLVSLRDCGLHCDVDDMIASQIVHNLGQSYTTEFMQTLFHLEKCLVILDGLDEWTHPLPSVSRCKKKHDGLPHRKARQNCTILTTTRSYKRSVINLKSSQTDNHIEIRALDEQNSRQLIANDVRKILNQDENAETIKSDQAEVYIKDIEGTIHSRPISEFETSPLVLTYMTCLLWDGKNVGRSISELYANILEFLLHRWEKRENKSTNTVTAENAFDSVLLPAVFRTCSHTGTYKNILLSLGYLAFKALFCENEERSFVFESPLMDNCLTKEEQTLSMTAGLLTQNKLQGRLTTHETTVSFSHKTFQEFFAALYIYTKSDLNDVKEQVLKKCNSLDNILEMSKVFIFLSGFAPERLCTLSKYLSDVINDDDTITEYRSVCQLHYPGSLEAVKNIQNMYIACVKESRNANHGTVNPLLEDIIIDRYRNQEHLQMLQNLVTNNYNIKSVLLSHCESDMDSHQLIRDLNLESIHTLESLQFYCPVGSEDLTRILAGSVSTLKHVTVVSLRWKSGSSYPLCHTLLHSSVKSILHMQYLISLQLCSVKMSHHLLESLIAHLKHRPCMKHILLNDIKCIDHDETCPGFNMDLSRHFQLATLGLSKLPLVHVEINTSALETCAFGSLQTSSAVSSFLTCLPDAKKLRSFSCVSVRNENDLITMMAVIPQLVAVTEINIVNADIKNKVLQLSPGNANIALFSMQYTTMSSISLEQLVQQVRQFSQSVTVELGDCTVTPAEEYERIIYSIKSSDMFEVVWDGEGEDRFGRMLNIFAFRTNKT